MPKEITISTLEIKSIIQAYIEIIAKMIKETLEQTPLELSTDIMEKGIFLSGGGTLLEGVDKMIEQELRIPVHPSDTPFDNVALGTGKLLSSHDLLKKTSIPSHVAASFF